MSRPRPVPPAPNVLAHLYMEYVRNGKPVGLTFRQYLHAIGFTDPAVDLDGMDDGAVVRAAEGGPELIAVPQTPVKGRLRIVVLLVDFADRPGTRPAAEYHDLLFSDGIFPTGSLRDFYKEVSGGKVEIEGEVRGWLRLPQRYAYYTNNESGMKAASYPRNAQRMAEHAVQKAVAAGVPFPTELDALGTGVVTALFIVHAGSGAETFQPVPGRAHIWSHKWTLRTPVQVGPDLSAATYLTVPEDCRMGVCAHELGHLAFQWEDFYDPNGGDDGVQWAGTGRWDLMAGGSWNGDLGNRPAHPIGLHKSQHDWVSITTLTGTTGGVTLPPYTTAGGAVVKVVSPAYRPGQFLLLENRQRVGFDDRLPGDGVLVWRVDLTRNQNGPFRPACQLVQADGHQDLENSSHLNQGDAGDPFPGSTLITQAGDTGIVSTSFPDGRSGVTLSNIRIDPMTRTATLDVTVLGAAPAGSHDGASAFPEASAPRAPTGPSAASLARLLKQPRVSADELAPLVRATVPTMLDVERAAMALPPVPGEDGAEESPPKRKTKAKPAGRGKRAAVAAADDPTTFGGWAWRRYYLNLHPAWTQLGSFAGGYKLAVRGPRDYDYQPDAVPLAFTRANGETITPGRMITDGGSVPRVAWLIPNLDPWSYMHAYALHDWLFIAHHCQRPGDATNTFERANLILAEAIYTLMRMDPVTYAPDWRNVVAIYSGVSTPIGRGVWDRQWDVPECRTSLPAD